MSGVMAASAGHDSKKDFFTKSAVPSNMRFLIPHCRRTATSVFTCASRTTTRIDPGWALAYEIIPSTISEGRERQSENGEFISPLLFHALAARCTNVNVLHSL